MSTTYVTKITGAIPVADMDSVEVFEGLRAPNINGVPMHFFSDPERTGRLIQLLQEKKIAYATKVVSIS